MRERGILRRSLGWLGVIAAMLVILAAVIVGIARLLLPLAPEYQDEIRRLVTEATGFDVRFETLRASWPLPGPQIRFSNVRIAVLEDQRELLHARDLTVGINLWRVMVDRQVRPGRIAVEGANLKAERSADGEWVINGVPLSDLLRRPRQQELPHLDLTLRDVGLLLLDQSRLEPRIALEVRKLELELTPEFASFDGELRGHEGLGARIEAVGVLPMSLLPSGITSVGPPSRRELAWDIQVAGADLDVARWLRVVANEPLPLVGGRGDLELQASFHGSTALSVVVDLDLGPTGWAGVPAADNDFHRLQLEAAWERTAHGWTGTLDRFRVERSTGG